MTARAVAAGFAALLAWPAPQAHADPGADQVTVVCGVLTDWSMDDNTPKHAGTVTGVGPTEDAARADAHRQIWGGFGVHPRLGNCRRA